MTTLRRKALLVLTAVATVIFISAGSAQASFSAKASLTASVGTTTVAAPTSIKVTSSCTTYDLNVAVSWKASTTAKVSGYTITAYDSSGSVVQTFSVGADETGYAVSAPRSYASYGVRVTITAQTSYGWTKESAKSSAITC